jgi:hypothetical protein
MPHPAVRTVLRALPLAALLAAAPALAPSALAQGAPAGTASAAERDAADLAAYRLSEDGLAKFAAASRNLIQAARAMPQPPQDAPADRADLVSAMAEAYERHPPLRDAIAQAGLTPREYSLFTLTLMQSSLGAVLVERDASAIDHLPANVAKENVRFVQGHQAQLQAIQAELGAAGGRGGNR